MTDHDGISMETGDSSNGRHVDVNGLQLPVLDADSVAGQSWESKIDLEKIREKLTDSRGPQYWRSLEELAETEEFQDHLKHEFPAGADQMLDPVTRRGFIKIMGASIALAGLSSCVRQPEEKIVPYVRAPEEVVPGKPLYFATSVMLGGYATGVLAESHTGRPTKLEGNPDHPASLGATDVFTQASVLTLYDPDRSQTVIDHGEVGTWGAFTVALNSQLEIERVREGAGLRILTETTTSPTFADQMRTLLQLYPKAKWYQYDPAGFHNTKAAARAAVGRDATVYYNVDKARIVLSLDADFMASMPGNVRYARHFIDGRRAHKPGEPMNRLYAVESSPTITGAKADHRLAMRASEVESLARAIASRLGVPGVQGGTLGAELDHWADAVARDLQANRGASVVVAGEPQPPAVHLLVHAINAALGNLGVTAVYTAPVEAASSAADQLAGLRELTEDMAAGRVETLIMIGTNPVYSAPADLEFAKHLNKVPFRAHHGLYYDETGWVSQWHLPASHSLEMWSDARAFDGTVSIVQPLIAPLYDSKSCHELIGLINGNASASDYDIVRGFWKDRVAGNFEKSWERILHDGVLPVASMSASAAVEFPVTPIEVGQLSAIPSTPSAGAGGLEINFRPDPTVWDGSFSNNGWLQELPKPLSKLTWDNAALVSPQTAQELSLENGEVVELVYQGRTMKAPIWIVPGHPDKAVTLYLGYGRERAGRVGNQMGFNANLIRTSSAPWFGLGLEIRKTGESYSLVSTQDHYSLEGRNIYRAGTMTEFQAKPDFVAEMENGEMPYVSLYPEYKYDGYAWGMAIDLSACIGCNVCTIACQAENNIPVVGKEQVAVGREMHWIRVDRYYEGDIHAPQIHHQPVPCMQCENASCETVCPVGATVHSDEGLNDMVYNRCVGTRYCSNNCPYKVRRFNFLQFSDTKTPSLKLQKNPDVTVRNKGVMEKCTYCVQRINHARIDAKREGREIRDGEIITACQMACPTGAIVFGNINDPNSRVAQIKASKLNYTMLAEVNNKPRTSYLAKLQNPNPDLVKPENNA